MLVVAIINSTVAILLVAHVMTCFWYFVGRQVENEGQQSWLSLEGASDKDPFTQYLHAFRYIMDAPSPPVITPDSHSDHSNGRKESLLKHTWNSKRTTVLKHQQGDIFR